MASDKMIIKSAGNPVFRGRTRDGKIVSGEVPEMSEEEKRRILAKFAERRRERARRKTA